jgi:Fur family peroxide stress response transcriptional regulator
MFTLLDESEVNRRLDAFMEACRKAEIRLTHQRIEVFREVAATDDHPDVETIFQRVRTRIPTISLDTVYRTLRTLEHLNVVSRVHLFCEPARFDGNMGLHHHLVCVECGKIRDLSGDELNRLSLPPDVRTWGEVKSVHVEVRGVCRTCAKPKEIKE